MQLKYWRQSNTIVVGGIKPLSWKCLIVFLFSDSSTRALLDACGLLWSLDTCMWIPWFLLNLNKKKAMTSPLILTPFFTIKVMLRAEESQFCICGSYQKLPGFPPWPCPESGSRWGSWAPTLPTERKLSNSLSDGQLLMTSHTARGCYFLPLEKLSVWPPLLPSLETDFVTKWKRKIMNCFILALRKYNFQGLLFPFGDFPLLLFWIYFETVTSSWEIEVLSFPIFQSRQELSYEHFCSPILSSWNLLFTLGCIKSAQHLSTLKNIYCCGCFGFFFQE